jgi:nucleotide-binding universal stress UspA family protein
MTQSTVGIDRPFLVLVGLELSGSASGGFALDQAARIALRIPGSQLHVLHVLANDANDEATREAVGELRSSLSEKADRLAGLPQRSVGVHVRRGHAAREIAQLANDIGADLIVLGTHRPAYRKSLFVGSTAEQVMTFVTCPVVVAGPRPRAHAPLRVTIDPPCEACAQTRFTTEGRTWWCAEHFARHPSHRHRVYSFQGELPFGERDFEVQP